MVEEQNTTVLDAEALKVDVRLLGEPQGKLIGLATVEYHGFLMDNFKVFNGENGLFLGEPTIRNGRSNSFVKTIHIKGDELRQALNQKTLEGYNAAVEKLIARAAAAKDMEIKPSVKEQLAEGKEQAAQENAARPTKVQNKTKNIEL